LSASAVLPAVALLAAASITCGCATHRPSAGPAEPRRALSEIPPDLAAAEGLWRAAPGDLDAIVWYGRRLGYEGRFEEAVAVYSEGLRQHPDEPELLRHRGHRYLSLRRFEEARADLERAAGALEGRPDRIEPDGAPNDYEVPRGTLHTNVWYHLGLAHHCLREDERAARAFAWCLAGANNDDFRAAAAYWRALALIHLGRGEDARALARLFAGRELELMESFDYAELLRLLAGTSTRALEELATPDSELSSATLAYGVAMWHRLHGREREARAQLEALLGTPATAAFGRIAAEVELARLPPR
jgi:tetratricopeptide (TPR) repeat protein